MDKKYYKNFILLTMWLSILPFSNYIYADGIDESKDIVKNGQVVVLKRSLPIVTQGPTWPPSTIADENGDFVVVGSLLRKDENGNVVRVLRQAAMVSKNTTPPLDEFGKEDFTNQLGAPYKVIRELDLKKGSKDLDIVLHTLSYGPPEGDFGGGPRIPRIGDSPYNLNSFSSVSGVCRELFPAESQRFTYTIPSFAMHQAAIPGYIGDNVEYDINTGEKFVPNLRNGEECYPDGCAGEDPAHTRSKKPITLGDWLKAKVNMTVKLTNYSEQAEGYTSARFHIKAKNLIPNAIYYVAVPRDSFFSGRPIKTIAQIPSIPSVVVTDSKGRAKFTMELDNPFPDRAIDDAGMRVAAIGLIFRPDYMYLGGCPVRFGAGVDGIALAVSWGKGDFNIFGDLLTVAAPESMIHENIE